VLAPLIFPPFPVRQAARETAKLQPAREAAPEFQDDEALKQAAAQVWKL
jgi:hypothetical protein